MNAGESDIDLPSLFDEEFPLPEGVSLPKARFGRTKAPPVQSLPETGPACDAGNFRSPLRWSDSELGVDVIIEYEDQSPNAEGRAPKVVWAYVEGDRRLDGKSASVAIVNEKGDRFIGGLVRLSVGPNDRCRGERCMGTVDEVRSRLGSDKITLDVFLME